MKGFPGDWVGVVDSTRKKVSRNWQSVLVFGKIGNLVSGAWNSISLWGGGKRS